MASKTDIANLALTAIECQVVEDIDTDESAPARDLRAIWTVALDKALSAREWNFNDKRWRDLPAVADSRHPAIEEFDYAYAKPRDCIKVDEVLKRVKFRVIGDYICTDAGPTITARGRQRITQYGRFPVWFVSYLAMELACHTVKPETGSETVRDVLEKKRAKALLEAGSMDSSEGTSVQPGSRFLASRLTDAPPDLGLLED